MATCGLKDTAIVKLAQAFDNLKNLLYLNICQNECRIMQLSSEISRFTELEHLDLSNCNITHSELSNNQPLSNKNLKFLNLSNNSITDEAVDQIVAIINNNKQLQRLNLSNCEFKPSGMEEIVSVLKTCTSLKYINLTSNIINDGLDDEIAAVIDNNEELSHVYLPNSVFNYKCVDGAFKKNVSLKKATLRTSQIVTAKLENLAIQIETIFNDVACISLTSGIKYLAVNFYFVSKQTLKLLIGYLNINNSSLEHLELAVSGLTEAYVHWLCNALRSFESLRFLSICCSDITVEAASSLSDVLKANNNSLQHLILHNCK
ncbi:protein NLRC3-like [Dysidea avara]|uniref:protein NLRC3-like n=1 Tax=Dysidea avara TaxID=196820 RepID=UPI003319F961